MCLKIEIPQATLFNIVIGKSEIKAKFSDGDTNSKQQSASTFKHHQIEDKLLTWFQHMRANNASADGATLQEKAKQLVQVSGAPGEVSDGWILRWEKRHGFQSATINGENNNVDESCLFWKLMPSKT